MRWFVFGVLILLAWPHSAHAQNENLDITQEPICFALRNTADYRVNGSFVTDKYMRPDGIRTRHRSNFRMDPPGSVNSNTGKPSDRQEYCSYGPFLPNRQLILTLRTLFPVFECKTRVDTGQEIVIKGARRADDNGVITWAECFEVDGTKSGKPPE